MSTQKELDQAIATLTDADMAELAGGKLSAKGEKIAKIAGITGASVIGAAGVAAGVTAIVGAAKHKDGGYYFKKMFRKEPFIPDLTHSWDKDYEKWGKSNDKYVSPVDSGAAYGGED